MGKDTLSAICVPFDAKDCHITAFIGSAIAQRFCTGLASSKWAG
jgi:hypothetical protein